MKKQILEELNDIKYLFNYNRGKIISEQEQFVDEDLEIDDYYEDLDEEDELEDLNYLKTDVSEDLDFPVMSHGTKEKERTKVTPGTKPKTTPKTPYLPKPGPKKNPKSKKRKRSHTKLVNI